MCLPTSTSFSLFGMLFHNSILFLPRRALGWLYPRIGQGGWYSWNHPKSPGSFPCLCCNMASLCLHGMSLKPMAKISPGLFLGSGNVLGASATFPWQITLMATQTTLDSSLAFNPGPSLSSPPPGPSATFYFLLQVRWNLLDFFLSIPKSPRRSWGAKLCPPSSAALLYLDAADPVWSQDRLERQSPCKPPAR